MPQVDFDKIDDPNDFTPLPDGDYDCRLQNIEERTTKSGDEMWGLEFVVTSGQYEGRKIFDNMPFSEKALGRVKLICSRLGLDTSKPMFLRPSMLLDRKCIVTVIQEEYEDENGQKKPRNTVPFAGYTKIENGESETSQKVGSDLPF